MILMILGAQQSPPETYFFVMFFLKITYWPKLKTFDFHLFFFAFLCSGNTPAPGASGDGFGGPGAYFSPIAGRRSGRYLRSKRGIRLQAQLRLAHVPTRSLAFLARFAPVPTRLFWDSTPRWQQRFWRAPAGKLPI